MQKMEAENPNKVVVRTTDSKDIMQQNKTLYSLTDHVEDRYLNSMRVHEAMTSIASSAEEDRNGTRMRKKELAAIKIDPPDVDLIAKHISRSM
jgi:hypothetical protein